MSLFGNLSNLPKVSEDITNKKKVTKYYKLRIGMKTKRQHQYEFLGMRKELINSALTM